MPAPTRLSAVLVPTLASQSTAPGSSPPAAAVTPSSHKPQLNAVTAHTVTSWPRVCVMMRPWLWGRHAHPCHVARNRISFVLIGCLNQSLAVMEVAGLREHRQYNRSTTCWIISNRGWQASAHESYEAKQQQCCFPLSRYKSRKIPQFYSTGLPGSALLYTGGKKKRQKRKKLRNKETIFPKIEHLILQTNGAFIGHGRKEGQ